MVGEVLQHRPFAGAIADRNPDGVESGQYIQLGHRQSRGAVEPDCVLERDQVQPAAATAASGRSSVLMAAIGHELAGFVEELGRERAGAHPRGVGLDNPPDLVDVGRPDAGADAGSARNRVG